MRSADLSTTALLLPLGAVRALLVETLVVFPAKDCPQRLQVTASARDNLWQLAQRFVCIQVSQVCRWYVQRITNDTCWYSKTYCTISCEIREPSRAKQGRSHDVSMGIDIGGETQLITCQVKGDRAKVVDDAISPINS